MWGKFPDDVSGPTAAPETSSENLPRTPCKIPKTKNQKSILTNASAHVSEGARLRKWFRMPFELRPFSLALYYATRHRHRHRVSRQTVVYSCIVFEQLIIWINFQLGGAKGVLFQSKEVITHCSQLCSSHLQSRPAVQNTVLLQINNSAVISW